MGPGRATTATTTRMEKARERSGRTTTERGERREGTDRPRGRGHTHIHTLRCTALRQPSARCRWPNDQKNNASEARTS